MTRRAKAAHASGFTVLLVDDNADYLQATRLLLQREGHNVLTATNGAEAISLLPQQKVDLLLLDYFMPGMTGEQVVAELRKTDPFMQVILQTGYASEQPPRELLHRLNIQGYYDKTEGPEQLLLWTTVGLKAAATTQLLFKSRDAISLIASQACRLQSGASADAVEEVVVDVGRLAALFVAGATPSVLIALVDGERQLHVRAGTGSLAKRGRAPDVCTPAVRDALERALHRGEVDVADGTAFPLCAAGQVLGVVFVDYPMKEEQLRHAVGLVAHQAAAAMYCADLAERAAVDAHTGAQVRAVFEASLLRETKAAFRAGLGVALALVDLDGLTAPPTRSGRLSGDRALRLLARALADAGRSEDVIGRYAESTFAVILRNTAPEGPASVAARLFAAVHTELEQTGGPEAWSVSVGYAAAPARGTGEGDAQKVIPNSYFASVAELLKATAAAVLGEVQRAGGGTVRAGPLVNWPRP